MSDKQTRCPNCATIYRVSVTQLTVAQGMVCCPRCSAEFNALLHLYQPEAVTSRTDSTEQQTKTQIRLQQEHEEERSILDIFKRKVANSNITLKTYLNNLNTFNHDPITNFPSLNLSASDDRFSRSHKKSKLYIASWTLVNCTLLLVFVFQLLWFNPHLLQRSPFLNQTFIQLCGAIHCETMDERYQQIHIYGIQQDVDTDGYYNFRGQLVNQYKKGLKLPLIKLTLYKDDQVVARYIKQPREYLIESLNGIERIPPNSPFNFKISINLSQSGFDNYKLEVIRP